MKEIQSKIKDQKFRVKMSPGLLAGPKEWTGVKSND